MVLELRIEINLSKVGDLMIVLSLDMRIKRGMVDLSMIRGMMIMRGMRKEKGLIEVETMIDMMRAILDLIQNFDFLDFEGKIHLEDFLDGFSTVERTFKYGDLFEAKKVKLVEIKFKNMLLLWENVKRQREREGKSKIVT